MLGALLAMATMAVNAGTTKDLESSAVINGTIVLAKDGTVQSATIDDEENFGKPIADMVRKTALQWRFKPVLRNDEPVVAKASMHARVVLKRATDGNYSAFVKGATFGNDDMKSTDALHGVEGNKKNPPRYPDAAIHYRVQGTVYLALHVDRSGHVTEAVAEQVNLENTGPDRILKQFRETLAQAALKAAREWNYEVPTTGALARQDSWTARVPVVYMLTEAGVAKSDSVWKTYVPGPYTPAPWIDKPDASATDAVADDGNDDNVLTDGAGPVLLSQVSHD